MMFTSYPTFTFLRCPHAPFGQTQLNPKFINTVCVILYDMKHNSSNYQYQNDFLKKTTSQQL